MLDANERPKARVNKRLLTHEQGPEFVLDLVRQLRASRELLV
jgi:hypothetical protein